MFEEVGGSFDMHLSIITSKGFTVYDEASHFVFVQIKRGIDETDIVAMEILFGIEGNSVRYRIDDVPAINGLQTYAFDLGADNVVGIPSTVSVAPIFTRGKEERTGSVLDKVNIPMKRFSEFLFDDEVTALSSKVMPNSPVCGDRNCQKGETCYDGIGTDCLYDCNICPMQVAYWKFENDINDSSGNDNNGTVFGSPNYVATPWGMGLNVSKNNGAVVPDSDFLDVSGAMSITAWVKYDDFVNHGKIVIKAFNDTKNKPPYEIYSLDGKSNGGYHPNFLWSDGDEGSGNDQVGDNSYLLSIGVWYHLTGVLDGTTARLYANGTLIASKKMGEFMTTSSESFWIGGIENLGYYTDGVIDEVMIFSYALNDTEVYNVFSTGNP